MARALTNAERQRRYIARLKEKAGPTPPNIELLIRAVIALKERNAELEAKLARAKRKLAKLKHDRAQPAAR